VRRQNGDAVEWWIEWSSLKCLFYSSGGCESGYPRRVTGGDGADSMLQFWLNRGADGTKHCRKMKRRQRAHIGSMGRKRNMA
jgi:hypothetical protein